MPLLRVTLRRISAIFIIRGSVRCQKHEKERQVLEGEASLNSPFRENGLMSLLRATNSSEFRRSGAFSFRLARIKRNRHFFPAVSPNARGPTRKHVIEVEATLIPKFPTKWPKDPSSGHRNFGVPSFRNSVVFIIRVPVWRQRHEKTGGRGERLLTAQMS